MNFIDAQAQAENLAPQFIILAARMTEDFSDEMQGTKLLGSADVYAPPDGGREEFEAVGLLGFDGRMALMDQVLLIASQDALREIAKALYQARLRPN